MLDRLDRLVAREYTLHDPALDSAAECLDSLKQSVSNLCPAMCLQPSTLGDAARDVAAVSKNQVSISARDLSLGAGFTETANMMVTVLHRGVPSYNIAIQYTEPRFDYRLVDGAMAAQIISVVSDIDMRHAARAI
jgi:hypothetical protein